MNRHTNYYEVTAENNYDLGLKLGRKFGADLGVAVKNESVKENWARKIELSKTYLEITKQHFPQYIEELEGSAKGAEVDFMSLWVLTVGDELDEKNAEKCTSIITNNGKLVSHNEDWSPEAKDELSILKKTIGDLNIFELYYSYSLGGCAASINSNGYVQTINTLTHTDNQIGVPRNVVARWLSETNDPIADFEKLKDIKRSAGYSHTIISKSGEVWSIESSAKEQILTTPQTPFVHTNHFLTDLKSLEADNNEHATLQRYEVARSKVKANMTVKEIQELASDTSKGSNNSIFNERTIGRIVFDLQKDTASVWLLREKEKCWIDYKLDFVED